MARHKKAALAEAMRFFGIGSGERDAGAAYDIKNFKVLPDGRLERRCGFGRLLSLGGDVRALHTVSEADGEYLLAVVGRALYRISAADGSYTFCEGLITSKGKAHFFEYSGILYLVDGAEIYRYTGGVSLIPCTGYIPLYGDGWDYMNPVQVVNEPINLLSPKIRVRYVANEVNTMLRVEVGIRVESVDRVIVDGNEVTDYQFSYLSSDPLKAVVKFSSSRYLGEVEVCMTLADSYWHDALIRSCTASAAYEGFSASRVFLYGGDGGRMFVSHPVIREADAASQRMDPFATPLYFPKGHEVRFGNDRAVTAVTRVGERMMICTTGGAWITDEIGTLDGIFADRWVVRPLSQTIGCTSCGGLVVMGGETPVSVSGNGIYRWEIDSEMKRECTVSCLSHAIAPHVPDGFFKSAVCFYARADDAVWFYLPESGRGRVYIYDCAQKVWYSYDGVDARLMLDTEHGVTFASGGDICRFDDARDTDEVAFGEREIVGSFESKRLDFGNRESQKRAVRIFAEADAAGGQISVGLRDGSLLDEVVFEGGEGEMFYTSPVNTPRFHRASVMVRARGANRQRILGFCVHTV